MYRVFFYLYLYFFFFFVLSDFSCKASSILVVHKQLDEEGRESIDSRSRGACLCAWRRP